MIPYTEEEMAAFSAKTFIERKLVYIWARDGEATVEVGFWNGSGDVALSVLDALTGDEVTRNFTARGSVLSVGSIPQSDDLRIRTVDVSLSDINPDVENTVRGYDLRQARIEIYRAMFSVENPRELIGPARARFTGFINKAPITQPPVGGQASVNLECVGCTRELTLINPELRSDESQQRRATGDRFFKYAAATGNVPIFWGLTNDAQERAIRDAVRARGGPLAGRLADKGTISYR